MSEEVKTFSRSDEGELTLTEADVRELLRAACAKAGGINAFARLHGFSAPNISAMLKERRGVPASVLSVITADLPSFRLDNGKRYA
jgi:hypothetical protein